MDESIGFSNVGGLHEHIQCLKETVLFPLIYKDLYEGFKIKPPKGVLFYGPPGTGKTLIAGALANECSRVNRKVSFFSHKGAECLTKWVGESEKHLRTLFEKAHQESPSIIFFDEIDGLAPVRSFHHDQVHSSVVSTLLALMDGINTKGQIVVIGATNRIDAIDPALRRPGRFDRELYFPLPSLKARYEILMVHAGRLSEEINLPYIRHLAATTEGHCGSDIQALCSEAVMCSVRRQFPEMYTADRLLDLNVSVLKVESQDFHSAKTKIVPAALRVSYTPSKRLSSKIRPLFGRTLCKAMHALRKTSLSAFIQERNGRRRSLLDLNTPYVSKGSVKNNVAGNHGNICPHFLLVGSPNQGQTDHLAPAMLHCLEDLPVTTLDITSLFEASGRTPEAACIQKLKEARQNLPGVLYMPDISGWWNLVDEASRSVFLTMVRELDAGDFPILLLATSHTSYHILPVEIQELFSQYLGQIFTMENPSEEERREFFSHLFMKKALKPPSLGDLSKRSQKQVLLCKVAVTIPCEETVKKKRRRKSEERKASTSGSPSDKCKGSVSSQQKQKSEEGSTKTLSIPAKKQKREYINSTDDENDEIKACSGPRRINSSSLLLSGARNRQKLHESKHQRRRPNTSETVQQLESAGSSNHVGDIYSTGEVLKDDEFLNECDETDDILSSSSSLTSISDEDSSVKKLSENNSVTTDTIQIDKTKLEQILNYTVSVTGSCTLQTILMLHSALQSCVSKYKDIWDRRELLKDLEENLDMFNEYESYPGRS